MNPAEHARECVAPIAEGERIIALDITRGAALLGVLLMNLETDFRMPLARTASEFHTETGALDHTVDWLLEIVVTGKSFAIFSLLFGVGLAMQADRATARGAKSWSLVRRLVVLLALGIAHLVLLWNGDILALYAVAGLIALAFVRRSTRTIAVALTIIAVVSSLPYKGRSPVVAADFANAIERAVAIYGHGTYAEIVEFRLQETARQMLPLFMIQLPRTIGLFLLGVLAHRQGIFRRPEEHRSLLRALAAGGGLVGGVGTLLRLGDQATWWTLGRLRNPVMAISFVPLALSYVALLLLFLAREPERERLAWLAPVGRMALTNYLVQSIVLGFVFYGYGFRLFGRLSSAEALPIGLTLFAAQIVASATWLRHYRFGPAEWLWRSATYGEWQPVGRGSRTLANRMS